MMMIALKWKHLQSVSDMRGNCLWVSYLVACLFTRTFHRIFILRCEYPMRLFSFCVYKGNEEMGIRKMVT
jgi:hypothetical protein